MRDIPRSGNISMMRINTDSMTISLSVGKRSGFKVFILSIPPPMT